MVVHVSALVVALLVHATAAVRLGYEGGPRHRQCVGGGIAARDTAASPKLTKQCVSDTKVTEAATMGGFGCSEEQALTGGDWEKFQGCKTLKTWWDSSGKTNGTQVRSCCAGEGLVHFSLFA